MTTRPQLVLLCGLPGAGKTTYARTHYPGWVRLEQDELKTLKRELRALDRALAARRDVVVSDTNTTAARRRQFTLPALAAGYDVRCVHLATPLRACVERCAPRGVPRVAVAAKAKEFEPPTRGEGFAEVVTVDDANRCICIGSDSYCDHAGRCAEPVAGCGSSNHYCDHCHLNAQGESRC